MAGEHRGRMVDVVQAAAAAQQKETMMITMKTGDDPSVVRWLDEILPLAMQPTPSGARLDLHLYFRGGLDAEAAAADDSSLVPILMIGKGEYRLCPGVDSVPERRAVTSTPRAGGRRGRPRRRERQSGSVPPA